MPDEQDRYISGVPCWVDTAQPDPEAAVDFYGGVFGWEFEDRTPAGAPGRYFVARLGGRDVAAVGSQMEGAGPTPVWNTYVWVESADDAALKAKDAGGQVMAEPFDVGDAGRMAVLADRSGAAFCVWQARGHRGAQVVNEPGSWNFSDLYTRDPDAAREFYGELFGWQESGIGVDGAEFGFWRLPGYGDFLERRDPELRGRLEELEAPEGFADAVATLVLMSPDQFGEDAPPYWTVTFAVDDADATAARAAELGGTVLVPPFDGPYVRMTVLRDPQGATFTASKYRPPQ
jgi:uncharacterized protein